MWSRFDEYENTFMVFLDVFRHGEHAVQFTFQNERQFNGHTRPIRNDWNTNPGNATIFGLHDFCHSDYLRARKKISSREGVKSSKGKTQGTKQLGGTGNS